jgi:predicted small secreted protein
MCVIRYMVLLQTTAMTFRLTYRRIDMKSMLIVLLAMSLGACSTVAGIGKDVTATAEWSRDKMPGNEKPLEQY